MGKVILRGSFVIWLNRSKTFDRGHTLACWPFARPTFSRPTFSRSIVPFINKPYKLDYYFFASSSSLSLTYSSLVVQLQFLFHFFRPSFRGHILAAPSGIRIRLSSLWAFSCFIKKPSPAASPLHSALPDSASQPQLSSADMPLDLPEASTSSTPQGHWGSSSHFSCHGSYTCPISPVDFTTSGWEYHSIVAVPLDPRQHSGGHPSWSGSSIGTLLYLHLSLPLHRLLVSHFFGVGNRLFVPVLILFLRLRPSTHIQNRNLWRTSIPRYRIKPASDRT